MSRPTRRHAIGATAGTLAGLALAGTAHASTPPATATPGATGNGPAGHQDHGAPEPFDEVFQGRRIQGAPSTGHMHHGAGYAVRIDGQELHVMRNADGTWISVVNHYEPFATPRAVARAAVVELQGAALVPLA
ncbi:tyrosinase [Streptomyces sp. SDr-06]|uniref:apotyrosinase chaperone MelC1 n=1 Tax=Streptomyces sp. SDr-06 TaxID=2267702 RepID=UPI000DEADFD2|nr:tyrosinase cofactor [Streptomyces sp. SDr-06]RCH70297.1 tyrosinase [Streptomyces sp. SDr-06]